MDEYAVIDDMIRDGIISADNIKIDTRLVSAGDVFIAVKGFTRDGHDHIVDLAGREAALVICEHSPLLSVKGKDLNVLIVKDSREIMGYIARSIYKDPSCVMDLYGITGTNGKTTTVFLINSILGKAGKKCGFTSTVYTKTGEPGMERSHMTTPGVFELYSLLNKMYEEGNNTGIIEISSHALAQKRVWGIKLDTAVFTNITPEHMDYHGNMDDYFRDKSKILGLLKKDGRAVLNADDPMVASLLSANSTHTCVTFGISNKADVTASDIKMSTRGTVFTMKIKNMDIVEVETPLIGEHNVYNVLAAVASVIYKDISIEIILSAVKEGEAPPGRLEPVILSDPFSVFVDYAHTPNALENVLKCLKKIQGNDIICVFGCGGDRDRTKRSVMGSIASRYADKIIITSDNPRTEDPLSIIKDIQNGISGTVPYSIIENRKSAVDEAIKHATPGDIVLIAGKGHEDYQIVGNNRYRFDDREAALSAIKRNREK